jgi:hypothetical protein
MACCRNPSCLGTATVAQPPARPGKVDPIWPMSSQCDRRTAYAMNNTLWRRLSGDDSAHCKDSNECFSFSRCLSRRFGGHLYALIALAFVVVYKASRVINFALCEWQMLATLLVATGLHVLGLDLAVAMAIACAGMFVYAFLFNSLVLRHLVGQPLISLLMVTLGVGVLIRGVAQLPSGSVPGGILLPIPSEPLVVMLCVFRQTSWSLRSLRHPRSRWSPGFINEAEPAWRCARNSR